MHAGLVAKKRDAGVMQLPVVESRYSCMNGQNSPQTRLSGPAWNGAGEWPFDVWLRRSLAVQHNAPLNEELPAEWLEIVEASVSGHTKR